MPEKTGVKTKPFANNANVGDLRMLQDIERKVLRILANYWTGRHRCPSIDELMVKTERSKEGIYKGVGSTRGGGVH
ncbi:hypothetical protein KNP414_01124 [Paenibacillus mucilaginosus KNP414]|uniref:Uncharacterized protein n=1 Tax=Paenibacillus mucilaginosus (strain KNP414) TaxID=1036673 RepID=F8FCX0_PAEMK|nr:hypothetical protein KNP414_01124 [Paenibacillus mucilaginosus KNP414]